MTPDQPAAVANDGLPDFDLSDIPDPGADAFQPRTTFAEIEQQLDADAKAGKFEAPALDDDGQPVEPPAPAAPVAEPSKPAEPEAAKPVEAAAAAEPATAAEPPKPAEPPPAPAPVTERPKAPEKYASIEDIDLDAVPEDARPWVDATIKTFLPVHRETIAAKLAYNDAEKQLRSMVERIGKAGDKGADQILTELTDAHKLANTADARYGEMAFKSFKQRNPDYAQAPEKVRSKFADALQGGAHQTLVQTGDLDDRIEAVWSWAKHDQKWAPEAPKPAAPAAAPAPAPAAATAPVAPAAPAAPSIAAKQAAANTSTRATTPRTADVKKMSEQEILDQHDHLLGNEFRRVGPRAG